MVDLFGNMPDWDTSENCMKSVEPDDRDTAEALGLLTWAPCAGKFGIDPFSFTAQNHRDRYVAAG